MDDQSLIDKLRAERDGLRDAAIDEGHSADSGYDCDVCRALAALTDP